MRARKENQSSSIDTKDIIKYYNEGHTIKECGLHFGMHPETIRVRFRKAGVEDCRSKNTELPNELIEYYKSGKTLSECSKKFGFSRRFISRKLSKLGVKRSKSEVHNIISKKSSELWKNEEVRSKMVGNNIWDEDRKEKSRQIAKKFWEDEQYKEKVSLGMKRIWDNDEFRSKMISKFYDPENIKNISINTKLSLAKSATKEKMAINRANQSNKVSSIQQILYSILDDLNIKHYRERNGQSDPETVIGPYNFDCVIPLQDKTILIECQGDYWHSLPKAIAVDKSKATYIERYYKDYEIKYLWEHEFKCKDKIVELIKYWTGKTKIESIDFDFDGVEIKECPAKDYKLLLSKYHYLPNAGRGGIAYGAYLGNELIAVCVFSPLIRQNMPYDYSSTRELSRLCIHPKYQKKNFASWFVSKCIRLLSKKYKVIISYCDTTFNHNGAIYRACNFKLDGKVRPDYWYISEDGWVRHKKTLYEHARKMSMKEKEYAEKFNYKRVYGKEKLRFIYER